MQISIIDLELALSQLAYSWRALQHQCDAQSGNSNLFTRASELAPQQSQTLQVLAVHDGRPVQELHALCVIEQHKRGITNQTEIANWVAEPGLHSSPLVSCEQRFSALTSILQELPSVIACDKFCLRHLYPNDANLQALIAISQQLERNLSVAEERKGLLRTIRVSLRRDNVSTLYTTAIQSIESMRRLPRP